MQKVAMTVVLVMAMAAGFLANMVVRFRRVMVGHDWPSLMGHRLFPCFLGEPFGEFVQQGFSIFPANAGIGN